MKKSLALISVFIILLAVLGAAFVLRGNEPIASVDETSATVTTTGSTETSSSTSATAATTDTAATEGDVTAADPTTAASGATDLELKIEPVVDTTPEHSDKKIELAPGMKSGPPTP